MIVLIALDICFTVGPGSGEHTDGTFVWDDGILEKQTFISNRLIDVNERNPLVAYIGVVALQILKNG